MGKHSRLSQTRKKVIEVLPDRMCSKKFLVSRNIRWIIYRLGSKIRIRNKNWIFSLWFGERNWFFLSLVEVSSSFVPIRTELTRTLVTYHYWFQQENFTFSQIEKENNALNKASYTFCQYGFGGWTASCLARQNKSICSRCNGNIQITFPWGNSCTILYIAFSCLEKSDEIDYERKRQIGSRAIVILTESNSWDCFLTTHITFWEETA